MSPAATRKVYDRAYFERWYRDPRHSVIQRDLLARRVQLAIAAAEYVLERPVRNVLDIGCGEAPWRACCEAKNTGNSNMRLASATPTKAPTICARI